MRQYDLLARFGGGVLVVYLPHTDPIGANARLGTYTNFVNLLDLCALAIPGDDDIVTACMVTRDGQVLRS